MNIKAECKKGKIHVYGTLNNKIIDDTSIYVKEILEIENEIELLENEKNEIIEDIEYRYTLIGRLRFLLPLLLQICLQILFIFCFSICNLFGKMLFATCFVHQIKSMKFNFDNLFTLKRQAYLSVNFINNDIIKLKNRIAELSDRPKCFLYKEDTVLTISQKQDIVEDKVELYEEYALYPSEYRSAYLNGTLIKELKNMDFSVEAVSSFADNIEKDLNDKKLKKKTKKR